MPPLAHHGVEPLGPLLDELPRMGMARRLLDLRVRGPRPPQLDVAADRVVEEDGFLGDNGHLAAQIVRGNLANIHPANLNAPALGIIEPQEQVGERGFPPTRWPPPAPPSGRASP